MSAAQLEEALAQLRDKDFAIRRVDMTRLAELADADTVVKIIEMLKDSDWRVRSRAAEALGEIGDASAVPMLVVMLQEPMGDNLYRVHDCATKALGKIGDSAAVLALSAMLNAKEFRVRLHAARALQEAGDASAVPALLKMLHTTDGPERLGVIRALAEAGDAAAAPDLIKILDGDDIAPVQDAAADALLALGDSETLPGKILACSVFTAHERTELLQTLRHIRYKGGNFRLVTLRYSFPDTRTLCRRMLYEQDEKARAGAQTVLNWLDGDRDLLIASHYEPKDQAQTLLRAAQGSAAETRPDTLLKASEAPPPTASLAPTQPPRRKSWFGKRNDTPPEAG